MKLPDPPPVPTKQDFQQVLEAGVKLEPEPGGQYLHWDELRRRKPPRGLSPQAWWAGVQLIRFNLRKELPLTTVSGKPFGFAMTEGLQRMAHQIDRDASGVVSAPKEITNRSSQDRYLVRSLIEEALTSSQLEGAVATAKEAKQLIKEGRKPRNVSERMVLNNYQAMGYIRERRKDPLDVDFICELHSIITTDTLDDPADAGRIRGKGDDIKVVDHTDNTILHTPPAATELATRMKAMCTFANGGGEGFVHPVARAVLLHFWLGHDHPFCDGNGRTARALFYWSMLHEGYWLTEYISISRVLKKAPSKYVRAYLYSETPPFDATHFVAHQLEAIQTSIKDLYSYIEKKAEETQSVEALLHRDRSFNHRQLAILSEGLRAPSAVFTMKGHGASHRISNETARQDLYKLRDMGLVNERKRGRTLEFTPVEDLQGVLSRSRKDVSQE